MHNNHSLVTPPRTPNSPLFLSPVSPIFVSSPLTSKLHSNEKENVRHTRPSSATLFRHHKSPSTPSSDTHLSPLNLSVNGSSPGASHSPQQIHRRESPLLKRRSNLSGHNVSYGYRGVNGAIESSYSSFLQQLNDSGEAITTTSTDTGTLTYSVKSFTKKIDLLDSPRAQRPQDFSPSSFSLKKKMTDQSVNEEAEERPPSKLALKRNFSSNNLTINRPEVPRIKFTHKLYDTSNFEARSPDSSTRSSSRSSSRSSRKTIDVIMPELSAEIVGLVDPESPTNKSAISIRDFEYISESLEEIPKTSSRRHSESDISVPVVRERPKSASAAVHRKTPSKPKIEKQPPATVTNQTSRTRVSRKEKLPDKKALAKVASALKQAQEKKKDTPKPVEELKAAEAAEYPHLERFENYYPHMKRIMKEKKFKNDLEIWEERYHVLLDKYRNLPGGSVPLSEIHELQLRLKQMHGADLQRDIAKLREKDLAITVQNLMYGLGILLVKGKNEAKHLPYLQKEMLRNIRSKVMGFDPHTVDRTRLFDLQMILGDWRFSPARMMKFGPVIGTLCQFVCVQYKILRYMVPKFQMQRQIYKFENFLNLYRRLAEDAGYKLPIREGFHPSTKLPD